VDRAGAVPHQVVAADGLHHQQHPERIGHREQAAAEVGAHVVAVPRAHAQLDPRMAVVVIEPGDVDATGEERRPQVDAVAEQVGFHATQGGYDVGATACHTAAYSQGR